MIHLCPDELTALASLGPITLACRYCWMKVAAVWRRR